MRTSPLTRVVQALTDRPAGVLFLGFLGWFAVWTVVAEVVLRAMVPEASAEDVALVARGVVPALGAVFAFLTGFAINTEWGLLRDAQHAVELEADAAARVALLAAAPGLDGPHLRRILLDYLDAVVQDEWLGLRTGEGSHRAGTALLELFRSVRRRVGTADTAVATGSDLLDAVDALVSCRRDRLSVARRTASGAMLLLAVVSGVVLVLEAVLLALPHERWVGLTLAGLVVVVALALALMLAVSAPYRGSIAVDARPLLVVHRELGDGRLGAVAGPRSDGGAPPAG